MANQDIPVNSNNYAYTPPVQQAAQPQVVYVNQKKSGSWWKYLLGCTFVLFLCACTCIVPVLFLSTLSAGLEGGYSVNPGSRVRETKIYDLGDKSAEKAKIAVINITDAISYSMPGSNDYSGTNSENINSQLRKAKDDASVDAVLLRFNTPGGEVVAAEPICNEIKEVSKVKPVYSFVDSMGASLGYLLPNCSKYIYSRPESITGSIGVILQAVDFYGILEKLGGRVIFVTNSEGNQKSGQEIFDKNSETYKTYQSILDETYEYFVNTVYEGRKINHPAITKEDIKKYADGRILSGNQAKNVKLVDELGQFNKVLESITNRETALKDKHVEVVEYNLPVDPFSQLFMKTNTALDSANLEKKLDETSKVKVMMQLGLVDLDTIKK